MGVLRITQALLNDFDLKVNHKRVYRLMKELGIQGGRLSQENSQVRLL